MSEIAEVSGRMAVVLLSGGLDSMVSAGLAREAGYRICALTIDYNQRHRREIDAAILVGAFHLVSHYRRAGPRPPGRDTSPRAATGFVSGSYSAGDAHHRSDEHVDAASCWSQRSVTKEPAQQRDRRGQRQFGNGTCAKVDYKAC